MYNLNINLVQIYHRLEYKSCKICLMQIFILYMYNLNINLVQIYHRLECKFGINLYKFVRTLYRIYMQFVQGFIYIFAYKSSIKKYHTN